MTVATRYYPFTLTIPPGFTPNAPAVVPVIFEDVRLDAVDIRVPPGPNGQVGFYITLTGTTIVPWGEGAQWIIANDEPLHFDVGTEANGGVAIVCYNLGVWPHTLYFRFQGVPMALVAAAVPIATIVPIQ